MPSIAIVEEDNLDRIIIQLIDYQTNLPKDCTGSTARLVWSFNGAADVSRPMIGVDLPNGKFSYRVQATDFIVPGYAEAQVELTNAGGQIGTTISKFNIRVLKKLV